MPPIRTMPTKPTKTERTHEENQERAYIAASRRSDRSLEARIESARRASEIHKRRTGRSLRVTEQDVVNEEMYEEEDDDLPTQYQRLSAHLSTTNMLFNRKLHDYIATQTAVRNAIMGPQHQYGLYPTPDAVQFAGGTNPFMGHQMPPPVFNQCPQTLNQPQQPCEPPASQQSHHQSPYPIPHQPQPHRRSASTPTLQQVPGYHYQQPTQHASSIFSMPQGNKYCRRISLPPEIDSTAHQAVDAFGIDGFTDLYSAHDFTPLNSFLGPQDDFDASSFLNIE